MYKKFIILNLLLLIAITGCTGEDSENIDENLPAITTAPITLITDNSARSGGEILKEGSSPISNRGICWSTNQNPTLDDNSTSESGSSQDFVSELTGLEPETQYFVRSYASNSSGIAYGNQLEFTTETLDVTAPCNPEDNSLDHQGMAVTFYGVSAGENHSFFGNYGVIANGMQGDLRVDFNHVPETGIYTLVDDFSLNRTLKESMISATLDQGILNSWCTSAPAAGTEIYVTKLAEDSYKITFCAVEFICLVGYSQYYFTSDGNITD